MKRILIDLGSFEAAKSDDLRARILRLSFDEQAVPKHPELLIVFWDRPEPLEELFPEIRPFLQYL